MNRPTPEHERTLRQTLHHAVDHLEPGRDPIAGFDDVGGRADRAWASRRRSQAGVVVLAAAAVVAVALALPGLLDRDDVDVVTSPPSTTEAGSGTTDVAPETTSTDTTEPVVADVVGVWPFATAAEADSWSGPTDGDPWDYADPLDTARSFLAWAGADRLELGEFHLGDSRSGEIVATAPASGRETYLFLRRIGASETWTVVGAEARYLIIERPESGDIVDVGPAGGASPVLRVAGSVEAFEGTVVVELRTGTDGVVDLVPGIGGTMGTMGVFAVELDASGAAAGPAVVLATTSSPRDGTIEQLAAVAVDLAGT